MIRITVYLFCCCALIPGCNTDSTTSERIEAVTYSQFEQFISETGYITDAEKYGWSIVQVDVFNYKVVEGTTWRKPDGINIPSSSDLPVTQVSYVSMCNKPHLSECIKQHSCLQNEGRFRALYYILDLD